MATKLYTEVSAMKFRGWLIQINWDNVTEKAIYTEAVTKQKRLRKSPIQYLPDC